MSTPGTALRVAVLWGGRSSERHVSAWTGAALSDALRAAASDIAQVQEFEWLASGEFRCEGQTLTRDQAVAQLRSNDLCALAVHGGEGEDGTLQGWLELEGIRYTGSGVAASAVAMDKWLSRRVFAGEGLAVAPGLLVGREEYRRDPRGTVAAVLRLGPGAFFVKPRSGGSSVSTYRVGAGPGAGERLGEALRRALSEVDQVLVEAAVEGVEVTCAVLGNSRPADPHGDLMAFPPVEIAPAPDSFFDHHQKYSPDGAEEHCPPKSLPPEVVLAVQSMARRAHVALGCRGVTRTDAIVPRIGDGWGPPVVLELNTLPGMTQRSLVPLSAQALGWSFSDLAVRLCRLALETRN